MESRFAKVLDSPTSERHLLKAKRKRAAYTAYAREAACAALPGTCKPLAKKLTKRQKLNKRHEEVGGCRFQKSMVGNYANFVKSGVPKRILFYQNGGWADLPISVVFSIKKDLQMKKATIEVEFDGSRFVLDFLHMLKLDLETEMQNPMAWIDEDDGCYFPEMFTDECCLKCREHGRQVYDESIGPHELKLHLEIDISGLDMMECTAESNTIYEDKTEKTPSKHLIVADADEVVQHIQANPIDEDFFASLRKKFLMGMAPLGGAEVVDMYRCSSSMREARYELFQKQVEITKKYRGDAFIQSAWLAAPKEKLSSILKYGAGSCGFGKSTYGIGIHLASANFPHIRLIYSSLSSVHHFGIYSPSWFMFFYQSIVAIPCKHMAFTTLIFGLVFMIPFIIFLGFL
jgi:hypothetical protein